MTSSTTWCLRPDSSITSMRIVDEFGWGSHSACGETSNNCLVSNWRGAMPSYSKCKAICDRDRAAGLTDPGKDSQSIGSIYQDLVKYEGLSQWLKLYPFRQFYSTDDLAAVSRTLLNHRGGILIELANAYKLPFNEAGVHYHFTVLGGYDANHDASFHFYLLNPDRVPRPGQIYGGDWLSIWNICNAGLCGMIRILT